MSALKDIRSRIERGQIHLDDSKALLAEVDRLKGVVDDRDKEIWNLEVDVENLRGWMGKAQGAEEDLGRVLAEVKRLRDELEDMTAIAAGLRDIAEGRIKSLAKIDAELNAAAQQERSTRAADVVGWMDSEGPVTVAPGKPKTA